MSTWFFGMLIVTVVGPTRNYGLTFQSLLLSILMRRDVWHTVSEVDQATTTEMIMSFDWLFFVCFIDIFVIICDSVSSSLVQFFHNVFVVWKNIGLNFFVLSRSYKSQKLVLLLLMNGISCKMTVCNCCIDMLFWLRRSKETWRQMIFASCITKHWSKFPT